MTMTDLTPDALAQLEAKLMADLEVVRRVRALLAEHGAGSGPVGAAGSASPPPQAALPETPGAPPKSREAKIADALAALPGETFRPDAFRRALSKERLTPDNSGLRTMLTQLIRSGEIAVESVGKGRAGSLYRRLKTPSVSPHTPTGTPVSPAEVLHSSDR